MKLLKQLRFMKDNFEKLFRKQNKELENTKEEARYSFVCDSCGCVAPNIFGLLNKLCTSCHSNKVSECNEQCEKCGCTFHYVVDLRNHICSSHYSLDVRKIS